MWTEVETIEGDTPGIDWRLTVHRFRGHDPDAPKAYLQAALHASELPGTAALHYLLPMLVAAEAEGRLAGSVTVVPHANPIGAGQHLNGAPQGRFDLFSRVNFNRAFPLIDTPDPALLAAAGSPLPADRRLKARLLALSLDHDIVLDLHCDDQSPSYLYIQAPLWPAMADLAAALGSEAVVVWDESSDGAFDEAALRPYAATLDADALARRAVSTVEFRGEAEVSPESARADARGLYAFLAGRGVLADDRLDPPAPFAGPAVPIENVEMVKAPAGGAILYHVAPGDSVRSGDLLAEILVDPGMPGGAMEVTAPQDGMILSRRAHRITRRGEDLVKLLGVSRSATARIGALEA